MTTPPFACFAYYSLESFSLLTFSEYFAIINLFHPFFAIKGGIMGGYFRYNRDSGVGYYVSDEDIRATAPFLGIAGGIVLAYMLIVFLIMAIITAPFATIFILEYLAGTFFRNNLLFFALIGALLTAVRLFIGPLSRNFLIRLLFAGFLAIASLCVFIEFLHMDIGVYTIWGLVSHFTPDTESLALIISPEKLSSEIGNSWFYKLILDWIQKITELSTWGLQKTMEIDHSSYTFDIAKVEIFAVLKTLVQDVAIGGITMIGVMFLGFTLLLTLLLSVALPYLCAFAVILLANKMIYLFRTRVARKKRKIDTSLQHDQTFQLALQKAESQLPPSMVEANKLFRQAANDGNPYAQFIYAQRLHFGDGALVNEKEAFYWCQKAALLGLDEAKYMLAQLYFNGSGTRRNLPLARAWLLSALRKDSMFSRRLQNNDTSKQTIAFILKKTRLIQYF